MALQIETLVIGPTATNAYVLHNGSQCVLVDPGFGVQAVLELLTREELTPSDVWLTHGHCDHMAGLCEVKAAYPAAPVWCPAAEADMLTDARRNLSANFGLPVTAPPAERRLPGGPASRGPPPRPASWWCDGPSPRAGST